jgi:hypothetical protein
MKTFQQYNQDHPEVYELYKSIAFGLIKSGATRLGSKRIIEEIRWHHWVKTNEPIKVGNNYTAYYARQFALDFPQFARMFDFKPLRSNVKIAQ